MITEPQFYVSIDTFDELFIDGVHEAEGGWFAVICHPGVDGNFADVYGESESEALYNANNILKLVNEALEEK